MSGSGGSAQLECCSCSLCFVRDFHWSLWECCSSLAWCYFARLGWCCFIYLSVISDFLHPFTFCSFIPLTCKFMHAQLIHLNTKMTTQILRTSNCKKESTASDVTIFKRFIQTLQKHMNWWGHPRKEITLSSKEGSRLNHRIATKQMYLVLCAWSFWMFLTFQMLATSCPCCQRKEVEKWTHSSNLTQSIPKVELGWWDCDADARNGRNRPGEKRHLPAEDVWTSDGVS